MYTSIPFGHHNEENVKKERNKHRKAGWVNPRYLSP
jgi:hypothetical protein